MLVIRRLFGTGTNCIAPSGLPLLLCLFPGLAPWAFLSRPCGASFAPETNQQILGRLERIYPGFPGSARFQRAHGFAINRARKMRALPGNVLTGLNLFLVAAGLFSEIRGEAFLKNSLTVVTEANYV